ncbi:MAG: hypothetical protein HYX69_00885 [Planctomycetia bacterium]|nr:hypothetical protein [Planctomycetia bacterium]
MKKFAAICAVLLVLVLAVQADARPRRCRGGKCGATIANVVVEPAGTTAPAE